MSEFAKRADALILAQRYRNSHKREFAPAWYPWQVRAFDAEPGQRRVMLLAANQCSGFYTKIETPGGAVPFSELIGEKAFDVVSWGGESRCVAQASGVFLKGIEPMFRFQTDIGFFDCSRNHRVLTKFGWISAEQLVWLVSGRHWSEIHADYVASYGGCESLCGQRPLGDRDSGPIPPPLVNGAQAHNRPVLSQADAMARSSPHIRTWLESGPSGTLDDPDLLLDLYETWPNPNAYSDDQWCLSINPNDWRSRLGSCLDPKDSQSDLDLYQSILASGCFLKGGERIISVCPIGYQPVLDTTVKDTQCYFAAGLVHHNTGKTMSSGYHTACDLTGDYPEDWNGFCFDHSLNALAMGVDNTQLKDVVQLELFGQVTADRQFSGGWIHPDEILQVEWSPQTTNLARRITIKGKYGPSTLSLRAYTQSKTGQATLSFAGTILDLIWIDECPPDELVGQLTVRTINGNKKRGGRIRYTMTPELGMTKLVTSFMNDPNASQLLVGPIPWTECPHLTPEVQESILADIPEYERDMRSKGIPFFGSGLVYPIAEERIKCEPFDLNQKPWLRAIKAIDLGIDHPTAIAWLAFDPEDDTLYVIKTYKLRGEAAAIHAAAANGYLRHVPCVFPHDVDNTEKGSGKTVRSYYYDAGLTNTLDFKNPDGSIFVEPGIMQLYERMRDGRFKVFSDCEEFWQEFRMYHRQDGKIVKEHDDIMDAIRYGAIMAPQYAVPYAADRMTRTRVKGVAAQVSR